MHVHEGRGKWDVWPRLVTMVGLWAVWSHSLTNHIMVAMGRGRSGELFAQASKAELANEIVSGWVDLFGSCCPVHAVATFGQAVGSFCNTSIEYRRYSFAKRDNEQKGFVIGHNC